MQRFPEEIQKTSTSADEAQDENVKAYLVLFLLRDSRHQKYSMDLVDSRGQNLQ